MCDNRKKTVILVASFGTSNVRGAERSIGAVQKAIADAFPQATVEGAYTSALVVEKLAAQGMSVRTLEQALRALTAEETCAVFIQPTHFTAGMEYEKLCRTAARYQSCFSSIVCGKALLDTDEDCEEVAGILQKICLRMRQQRTAVLFAGHGSKRGDNRVYHRLAQALQACGNGFIAVMQGRPSLRELLPQLEQFDKIQLYPFLLTAGYHAGWDLAGEGESSWMGFLKSHHFEVACVKRGMGEEPEIQRLYVRRVESLLKRLPQNG